jgi:hypothetical protein
MSERAITPCCKHVVDKQGREIAHLCEQHQKEFDERRAAAVASCSHVNRDLVGG